MRSDAEYEAMFTRLMRTLVTPPAAPARSPAPPTRIATTLKAKFRAQRILGTALDDVSKHLVVPNFPINEDEGLFADFVIKNGAYHVTETADLRAATATNLDRVRSASFIAIKLLKAKETFGPRTKRFVVYASRKGVATQAVNLIGDFSDAIFHLESRQDMASYMDRIMQAASPTRSLSDRN